MHVSAPKKTAYGVLRPVALAAAAVATAMFLTAATASATGQVGEPAADFSLIDTQDNPVQLSDSAGEVRFLFMIGWD